MERDAKHIQQAQAKPWFRVKSYGYGAGLPIAPQGWALLGLHIIAILGTLYACRSLPSLMGIAITLLVALAPIPIYRAKTEKRWRWRWGEKD